MKVPSRLAKEVANRKILHAKDIELIIPEVVSEPESEEESNDEDIPRINETVEDTREVSSGGEEEEQVAGGRGEYYRWRKHPLREYEGRQFHQLNNTAVFLDNDNDEPIDYFRRFFSEPVMESIAQQSNLYSVQSNGGFHQRHISKYDIEKYMGAIMLMGVYKLPQTRMMWSNSLKIPAVSENITRTDFDHINKNLHFNDNTRCPPEPDKLYKVRPLLDAIVPKFKSLPLQERLSIDEQIIPTRGRSPVKQYMPNKPHKWGVKVWALCGVNGLCYNIIVYTGKSSDHGQFGLGGNVVLLLIEDVVPKGEHYKIAFDNFFTGIPLLEEMYRLGWLALGTIRANRLKGAANSLKSERQLKQEGHGSHDWTGDVDTNVAVVRWYDKSLVQIASNYVNGQAGNPVDRWSNADRKYIQIPCPKIVNTYNQNMGGVDLCDGMTSYYRVCMKTRKWYRHIFFHLMNLSITNSWVLYRGDADVKHVPRKKQLSLIRFQAAIANSLLQQNKPTMTKKRGRPSNSTTSSAAACSSAKVGRKAVVPNPERAIQKDLVDHFPVFTTQQQRCRLCTQQQRRGDTRASCSKCNVHLCLNPGRNCFYDWHH
jgi:hypothetical protein